jgi:hypothetical protein
MTDPAPHTRFLTVPWQVRPTYDAYGNYLGQQSVNVCQ